MTQNLIQSLLIANGPYPVGIYMFKFNNRNTRTRYEMRSKLTIKTPERHQNDVVDSMISGIDQQRSFPGAMVNDMYD